jgi:hypothetical protein
MNSTMALPRHCSHVVVVTEPSVDCVDWLSQLLKNRHADTPLWPASHTTFWS